MESEEDLFQDVLHEMGSRPSGSTRQVKLVAGDGQGEFVIDRELACYSSTIRAMLESPLAWSETSGPIPTIRFEELDSVILGYVIDYLNYRKLYAEAPPATVIPDFEISPHILFPLMRAAHYLGV